MQRKTKFSNAMYIKKLLLGSNAYYEGYYIRSRHCKQNNNLMETFEYFTQLKDTTYLYSYNHTKSYIVCFEDIMRHLQIYLGI